MNTTDETEEYDENTGRGIYGNGQDKPDEAATHTPTPWHVGGRICGHFCGIYAERGAQIADCTSPDFFPEDSKHNAAFIVRAVNSHAQLVEALEIIAGMKSGPCPIMHTLENAQDFARAALAAAKKGQQ